VTEKDGVREIAGYAFIVVEEPAVEVDEKEGVKVTLGD